MPIDADLAVTRRSLGLSQIQLAALLGVTQGTVSRAETSEAPDRRYVLAMEGLAARADKGDDLVAAANAITAGMAMCSACEAPADDPKVQSCTAPECPHIGREAA